MDVVWWYVCLKNRGRGLGWFSSVSIICVHMRMCTFLKELSLLGLASSCITGLAFIQTIFRARRAFSRTYFFCRSGFFIFLSRCNSILAAIRGIVSSRNARRRIFFFRCFAIAPQIHTRRFFTVPLCEFTVLSSVSVYTTRVRTLNYLPLFTSKRYFHARGFSEGRRGWEAVSSFLVSAVVALSVTVGCVDFIEFGT